MIYWNFPRKSHLTERFTNLWIKKREYKSTFGPVILDSSGILSINFDKSALDTIDDAIFGLVGEINEALESAAENQIQGSK